MFHPFNVTTFYVSQETGNDCWTGFYPSPREGMSGPLKTIEKALEKVSDMRRAGALQPVSIKIVDEEYFIKKPVVIGRNISSVTIESLTKARISGGIRISNFREDTFNGVKCLSAYIPEVKESGMNFTDFYVDGRPARLTRYPETGFLTPESVENPSEELFAHSKWFIARKSDIEAFKKFSNFKDCMISYTHYWVDEHTPIESYDFDTGKVVFAYKSLYSIATTMQKSMMEYKIVNVPEAFKNPNEWYLDRESGMVYYIPRDDSQTADSIRAYAPVAEKFFEIKGEYDDRVRYIHLKNLSFAYTKGDYKYVLDGEEYACGGQGLHSAHGSIEFEFAHGCSVENCTLFCFGVHGIIIGDGCNSIRIKGNSMRNGGASGIKVDGAGYGREPDRNTYGIELSYNLITECGMRYAAACGMLVKNAFDTVIAHNEISHMNYTGISCGWTWGYSDCIACNILIEKNYIHHLGGGILSDMGGIYLLGKHHGTIVRNNLIHDVDSRHYGGWGLYADEGSSYILFENNICYNMSSNCFHQHFGCMNTVRNNIFVFAKETPVKLSRSDMHIGFILERNIMVSNGNPMYSVGYGSPESAYAIFSNGNIVYDMSDKRVTLLQAGEKIYDLNKIRTCFGFETDSIEADPMFEDLAGYDFRLKPESPALKAGFKPIDISDIGIC